MLFIKQCNELSNILPGLFEQTSDYTEILFNISFNDTEDVVFKLVNEISESNFNVEQEGQVEIIGWLYQFYNTEPKKEAFAKEGKTTKNELPAVTQLFTPDWIVRYMVENSLGRLWVDGHSNQELINNWKYYLEEAEQEDSIKQQLQKVKNEHSKLKLEEIKIIDPCMGSGHILVYAFDVLMQIYRSEGWTDRDAVESILKNNLYGLDIDERAYQLSYFAVMMKAREYSRRVFEQGIYPNVFAIQESNNITEEQIKSFGSNNKELIAKLIKQFRDAKEIGSLFKITLTTSELDDLDNLIDEMTKMSSYGSLLSQIEAEKKIELIYPLIRQGKILSTKYDVVVTNPPYMPISSGSSVLNAYVNENYVGGKTDLFSAFIEKGLLLSKKNSYLAMITMQSWMFLTSYEKVRDIVLKNEIVNMAHLGARGFDEINGEVVQTVAFVIMRSQLNNLYNGYYSRLVNENNEKEKATAFLNRRSLFINHSGSFKKIPQHIIAYWVSINTVKCFDSPSLSHVFTTREGMATADNERFLRLWTEVDLNRISFSCQSIEESINDQVKWVPYNKGGTSRKWYGNNDYVVDWSNDGFEIKNNKDMRTGRIRSHNYNGEFSFLEGATWSAISSGDLCVRYCPPGFLFDSKGAKGFSRSTRNVLMWIIGYLNSKVSMQFLQFISPTLDFKVGDVALLPYISNEDVFEEVVKDVKTVVNLSKQDWDSFETSWDFMSHPLVRLKPLPNDDRTVVNTCGDKSSLCSIDYAHTQWMFECEDRFNELKANEEEINRIFIDMYGLQEELTPEVDDNDITVKKANYQRDVKSLISYAVGCMFGRYSLDEEGLIYAGGDFEPKRYKSFNVDMDNIIPVRDEEYFEDDDIVSRFVEFIKTVYGSEELEENLDSIAKALKPDSTLSSREVIRQYFLNDFFKDHCQTYQVTGSGKRPIYWLFDSGKQNGFKALIYMHRYDETTCARVRTDYLHKVQLFYENGIANDEYTIEHSSIRSDVTKATKHRDKLLKQLAETRLYDQALAHIANQRISIDLDDGVKINYAKFQDVEVINEGSKKVKVNLLASIK